MSKKISAYDPATENLLNDAINFCVQRKGRQHHDREEAWPAAATAAGSLSFGLLAVRFSRDPDFGLGGRRFARSRAAIRRSSTRHFPRRRNDASPFYSPLARNSAPPDQPNQGEMTIKK